MVISLPSPPDLYNQLEQSPLLTKQKNRLSNSVFKIEGVLVYCAVNTCLGFF